MLGSCGRTTQWWRPQRWPSHVLIHRGATTIFPSTTDSKARTMRINQKIDHKQVYCKLYSCMISKHFWYHIGWYCNKNHNTSNTPRKSYPWKVDHGLPNAIYIFHQISACQYSKYFHIIWTQNTFEVYLFCWKAGTLPASKRHMRTSRQVSQ